MAGVVQFYQSTDASAPVLTGSVGSLTAILDACLVNGYGSKAPAGWSKPFANVTNTACYRNNGGGSFTATVAAGVMTVSAMASGAIVVGASITGVGVPTGVVVTSLGTATNAGQTGTYNLNNTGFTISTGTAMTSGATRANTAASATGFSVYVNDNGPGAGAAREAFATGFMNQTSLGAGTGQFPTTTQLNIGIGAVVWRKSNTADATARVWRLIADDTVFYLFPETGDYLLSSYPFSFGDIFAYGPTDTTNCLIIGRIGVNIATPYNGVNVSQSNLIEQWAQLSFPGGTALSNILPGHYMPATWTNSAGVISVGKHTDYFKSGNSGGFSQMGINGQNTNASNAFTQYSNQFNFPNAPDGGCYVAPCWIHHNGCVRGYMKGVWCPMQNQAFSDADTYTGTGNMNGKSLIALNIVIVGNTSSTYGTNGMVHMEYSDTWS